MSAKLLLSSFFFILSSFFFILSSFFFLLYSFFLLPSPFFLLNPFKACEESRRRHTSAVHRGD